MRCQQLDSLKGNQNKVIGIVQEVLQGYVSFKGMVVSQQTGEPPGVAVNHSGLAVAVPSDGVFDRMEKFYN